MLLVSCTQEYDDSALKEKIDALSSQVAKCVQQVNELNTQVQGLNAVIEQWKAGGFVESIQEISGGYTIKFVGGQTVTLYNGKDGSNGTGTPGADGHSPVVSVKADADGQLYWAVDDEFLLDAQGNKVPVNVTPSFRINDAGELIVTIGGVDKNLGLVKGAGNSIFESVVPGDETVVFTLVTGISFEIPMVKAFKLVIDTKSFTEVTAGQQIAIPYTVQNGQGATVMAFAGGMYKASVDEAAGKINVTVPTPAADGQIMAWAQTETVVSPIIILSFTVAQGQGQGGEEPAAEVVIVSQPETYQAIPMAGGEVAVSLTSNVDIVVEQPSVDWVSAILTKADYTLTLTLAENTGAPRSTVLKINRADNGETVQRIQIAQLGNTEPSENPYGDAELPVISTTTTWAGSYFDAIVTANAASGSTEWISPDGENFINGGLGYFAGHTESVDETTGEQKITYGKFKFKISENAGTSLGKMSRVQLGGTGVLGKRNILQFKVAGSGKLILIGRSGGDAARNINIAVGSAPVSDAGFELPGKASDAASIEKEVTAAEGDIISIYSMNSGINLYSIKWVPAGSQDDPVNPPVEDTDSWDFSQSAWQTAFAALGEPATELAAVNLSLAGLDVVADAKAKYGTNYFQMPGGGSTSKNCFKFTAQADGVVTVAESHTSSTSAPDPIRYVVVYNDGRETQVEGSVNSKNISNCKFNVKAGDVYVYGTGGMRFYKISFAAGESYDPENPGVEEAQGELECPNPPTVGTVALDQLTGYAANVTGGANGNVLHFNSGKALQTWLLARTKSEKAGDHTPVTIWLSGTFKPDDGRDFSEAHPWFDVKDVSNLSFIGTDSFVMDRIGIFCVRASNIVIRNINFQQPKASNGADAVSLQNCDGVWVDHCTFTSLNQTKDYEDGSTDVTHGSKNVTVSWCRYIKTQKSCLVGHSNSASGDAAITATFHHNWFDGSSSRHPRVRFGRAHVYNNLFDGCTTYGVGSAYGAKVLVEYNYFDGVQLPTDICTYPAKESNESNLQGSVAGYLYPTQNVYVNRPAKAKDPYPLSNVMYTAYNGTTITPLTYADFKPAYSYTVTAAEDVPAVVKAGAGYGKLGFSEAPIAVNNGGITEFNGTDDDPVDPDEDDPDEPGDTPATGLADGWSWVINNGSMATYSVSDGNLTINGTGKWESSDQKFGAVYREIAGDFTAVVKLVSYNPQKDSNQASAGIIIIDGDASATGSNLVFAMVGNKYGNFRAAAGGAKSGFTLSAPETTGGDTYLKMVREGNNVKLSYSLDGGNTYGNVSSKAFTALSETVKIGLVVNSGDNSKTSTAVFSTFTVNDTVIAF